MRAFLILVLVTSVALPFAGVTNSGEKKEEAKSVTLKGKVTCAKCDLKLEKKCTTVIVVDEKSKKEIIYYFDKDSHDKYHEDVCAAPKNGTIEAKVKTEGKMKVVSVQKVTY